MLDRTPTVLSLLVLFSALACGPGPNDESGGDHRRSAAMPIDMGGLTDDKVDPDKGDATDWKKFSLADSDTVTVSVYFDNARIRATVMLRDAFGSKLKTCDKEPDKDCTMTMDLQRGEYYVGIHSGSGSSVYTMTVELGSGKIPGSGSYDDPRPE